MKKILIKENVNNEGFTLIEMLIVVLIIGILAAITLIGGIMNRLYTNAGLLGPEGSKTGFTYYKLR